jgi:tRNA(His) guanylyltransferase
MTQRDDLGGRMKEYEAVWDGALPRRLPLVIRVDGRAFHGLKLRKPFDEAFFSAMEAVALALCREIQGAKLAYFQSDEVSVVARDDMAHGTQPWLGKRVQKMVSLAAAIATAAFNGARHREGDDMESCRVSVRHFDARAFVLPNDSEVFNYLIWRQQDAVRNSIQMAGQAVFSQKELHNVDCQGIQQRLRGAGKPWEDHPQHFRRGALVRRVTRPLAVKHSPPYPDETVAERRAWEPDRQLPIFSGDPERLYLSQVWNQ